MSKLSVIIPSRNEQYLQRTIDDVFSKAIGEVEVIAILDGYLPNPPLKDHPNLVQIHRDPSQGLRPAVNSGAAVATGKFILKTDAHCRFEHGFDEVLKKDCDFDWLVIPRRVCLDAEKWEVAK